MIGKQLGPFQVVDLLGKGGMGEVYRARDTKLDREVAIKVLPREMSADPERVARFQREARSLAALQHPNVASVYGFEELPEARFLVMELVEGEELAERLARGPLSPAETERIAREIAAGLAAAHDEGLVHRDLKPANIKITPDGEVKILDFGLARAYAGDGPESADLANSPTITAAMTQAGTILGTAAYMSPEQARGQTADRRADVWAFGCVVFECLTGTQAYGGDTVTDVIAAIIHRDPDWALLPASTPPGLRRILEICLAKSRTERLRDMGDVALLLDHIDAEPEATGTSGGVGRTALFVLAAAALGLVIGAFFIGRDSGEDKSSGLRSFAQLTDLPGVQSGPSISPDGNQIAYASEGPDGLDVFLQRVSGTNPINLTADNPSDDLQPAFSPDAQRIAFASARGGGGIHVMGATGETPLRVTEAGFNPAWSPDGNEIAFVDELVVNPLSRNGYSQLRVVNLATREVRAVGDVDAMQPDWSPSGRRIVFSSHLGSVQGQRDLWTVDLASNICKPLIEGVVAEWSPVWSADGNWIYYISDEGGSADVWRIPVDEAGGEASGTPERVTAGPANVRELAYSSAGRLVISSRAIRSRLWVAGFDFDRAELTSGPELVLESSRFINQMDVSHDGTMIAYHTGGTPEYINVLSLTDGSNRRIFGDKHRNRGPQLSADGRWLMYYTNRTGSYDVWAIRTDGTGDRPLTGTHEIDINVPHFVGDDRIYLSAQDPESWIGYLELPPGGIDEVTSPLQVHRVEGSENSFNFMVSPNGTRFASDRDLSNSELLVWEVEADGTRLSSESGIQLPFDDTPRWLDDDRLIVWDTRQGACVVYDTRDDSKTVVEGVPGPSSIDVARTAEKLVINVLDQSTELWLIEIDER